MGSYCLMGTEFVSGMMASFGKASDGSTALLI